MLYATNSFIKGYELSNYFKKSELLSHIYCLIVSKIDFDKKLEHYHVTFTKKSEYFKLNSQIEKVNIDNFENIISNILFSQYTFDEIKKFIENWAYNRVSEKTTDIDIRNLTSNLIQREDSIANCFKAIENTVKQLSKLKLDKKFEPHLKKLLQYPQKIIELEKRKSIKKTDKDKIVGKRKKTTLQSEDNNLSDKYKELLKLEFENERLCKKLIVFLENIYLNRITNKDIEDIELIQKYIRNILSEISMHRINNNDINQLKFDLVQGDNTYKNIHKRYLKDFSIFMKKFLNVNFYWSSLPDDSIELSYIPNRNPKRKPKNNRMNGPVDLKRYRV